jgi:hypothetical protein
MREERERRRKTKRKRRKRRSTFTCAITRARHQASTILVFVVLFPMYILAIVSIILIQGTCADQLAWGNNQFSYYPIYIYSLVADFDEIFHQSPPQNAVRGFGSFTAFNWSPTNYQVACCMHYSIHFAIMLDFLVPRTYDFTKGRTNCMREESGEKRIKGERGDGCL